MNSFTAADTSDQTGATMWARSLAAGIVIATGKWAVSLP